MREGGRPRLIIDFQAERAVPKQSAECKPCAKVRVTDTPAMSLRYITFSIFSPLFLPILLVLFQPLPLWAPVFPLPFLQCCAVLLHWYCTVCTVCPSVLGTQARRQGQRQGTTGAG